MPERDDLARATSKLRLDATIAAAIAATERTPPGSRTGSFVKLR
jgi:hypothetical protein